MPTPQPTPPRRPTTLFRSLALVGLLVLLAPLGGCIAAFNLPEERPVDYAMLLTVYPTDQGPLDPAFRSARYAVEPDGLLRAETGDGVAQTGFPPVAQRLEPAQIDAIYALTRDSGVRAEDTPRVPGPTVYRAPAGRAVAVVEIASQGRYHAFELDADPEGPAGPLIRQLARLAWTDQ